MRSASLLAIAALLAAACGGGEPAPATEVRTYTTRGVVRGVAGGSLSVRHEAIPEFEDLAGEVVGMDSMTMQFALAPEVDASGIAPGDKISFVLEVDWEARPPARIVRLEALAPDTALVF